MENQTTLSAMEIATSLDNINVVARNLNEIDFESVVLSKDPKALYAIESMERAISEMENKLKLAKDAYAEVKQRILDSMESAGIKKIENDHFLMTAKSAYTRSQFDTKAFKKDHPELAEEYTKIEDVKSSLLIKLK